MADNVVANPGAGGSTFATDDIGGVHYPRSKVTWGPDGTSNDTDDASGKRLPVKLAEVGSVTVPVSDAGGSLTVDGPLTDAELRAAAVPVADGGGSITIDGTVAVSGTVAVQDNASKVDDAAFAPGTDRVLVIGAEADEAAPDAVDEGDAGALRMTLNRALHVNLRDASGAELAVGGGTQYDQGTATTDTDKLTMAGAVRRDTAAVATGVADGDRLALSADASGRLRVTAADTTQPVSGTVTANLGTIAGVATEATLATRLSESDFDAKTGSLTEAAPATDTASSGLNGRLQRIAQRLTSLIGLLPAALVSGRLDVNLGAAPATLTVQGDVAQDGVDSGNPVKVGGEARSSDPTAVANADRVEFYADLNGKQITLPYSLPENMVSGATAAITDTTSTPVIAAPGAGIRLYITQLLVTNSHATVGTVVEIRDGSGGTVLQRGYAAPAGGGFAPTFPVPLRLTANTALHAVNVTTGSSVYVSASGYKAP